jgi:NH3-dependent NAD+ synthetase
MPLDSSIDAEAERLLLTAESIALNIEVISALPAADQPQQELAALKGMLDTLPERALSNMQARARTRFKLAVAHAIMKRLREV